MHGPGTPNINLDPQTILRQEAEALIKKGSAKPPGVGARYQCTVNVV